ncbi:hypothetical protein pdam_00001216 [Pocillopora damicornis]|uniref:Uncharacterized protein n=1 Tax=Pocillopora damicornis TaxID=46731 RepID=A0A3M6TL10_POCDA|nr:hypothetical protein pdam_00001216 [Pocillopora damicornis]
METVRFGKVDFAVFGIMLLQSTAIGIYHALAGGEQRTTKEFLFANRGMMAIPVALSLIASFMSAITILGVPAEIYIYSTQYWLLFPSVALFFVPVFRAEYISSSYKRRGYRLPRHQGDSPPANSPPRNDLATNLLAPKRSLLATNHQ